MTENLKKSLENMDTATKAFENLKKAFEAMFTSIKEKELEKLSEEIITEINKEIDEFSKTAKININKLKESELGQREIL